MSPRSKIWNILPRRVQRINAFEMWHWRRKLWLPWTVKLTNESIIMPCIAVECYLFLLENERSNSNKMVELANSRAGIRLSYRGEVNRNSGRYKKFVHTKITTAWWSSGMREELVGGNWIVLCFKPYQVATLLVWPFLVHYLTCCYEYHALDTPMYL